MKKRKIKSKIIIVVMLLFLSTGCTTTLVDKDNKAVQNPETGQSLTENILCQPENEQTRKLYEENGVKLKDLPKCSEFTPGSTEYDGLWTGIFVKPLAFIILTLGKYIGSFALSIIIITIIIRLILFPFTRKMAVQSEMMKKASPELARIQKKYEGKTDDASKMRQAQEMQNLYKKYNINPLGTLLTAFIQFPIIIAIYQSVQRSAAVATGSMDIFGNVIHFEMTPWEGIMSGQFIYLIVFLIMAVLYFLSMQIPMLITKQKAKKEAAKHHRKPDETKNPMGNMMYYMMIPILVLSIMWPTGMTIYWIISSLVIILRTLLVQYVFIDKLQNKDKAGK